MTIADLLEIQEITLSEPLFSDLLYQDIDTIILQEPIEKGKILVDEEENPVIFAGYNSNIGWIGCCTLFRNPSLPLIEYFEEAELEMYQENRSIVTDTVREYYSKNLQKTVLPGPDDLNPNRASSIDELLKKTMGFETGSLCLDCCCGTGVGSMVMRDHGMIPLAYDNDESLLVRGMNEGRLKPERTMWIDGRLINDFLTEPVPVSCGFMIGEVHSFNAHIWKDIIIAACNASEKILFTTGTEPEIIQVKDWASEAGKKVEIFESDSDPIYDRWICFSE